MKRLICLLRLLLVFAFIGCINKGGRTEETERWLRVSLEGQRQQRRMGPKSVFLSFEREDELKKVETIGARVSLSTQSATEGKRSLKVVFEAVSYPVLVFHFGRVYENADWSGYEAMAFDLFNPQREPVPLLLQFGDSEDADGVNKGRTITCTIRGRGFAHLQVMPLGLQLGISGFLLSGSNLGRVITWGKEVDVRNIVKFVILMERPRQPITIYLDNFHFLPARADPLVDRFGQYARRDWKGKVHQESDLERAGKRDLAWADRPIVSKGQDKYGGFLVPPEKRRAFSARGFFYLEQSQSRWWLVTPEGNPFYSLGVTGVVMGDQDMYWRDERRKTLLEWIPAKEGRFAGAWEGSWTGGPNFYKANLIRKYGETFWEPWAKVTLHRLLSWRFNTLGCWSDSRLFKKHLIPYTVCLSGFGVERPEMIAGLPDVFDPKFAIAVDRAAKEAEQFKEDPWLIGYFYDNELFWSGGWGKDENPQVAQQVLRLSQNSAAKKALVKLLQERYDNDISGLNRTWGTSFEKFEALLENPIVLSPESEKRAQPDFSAFLSLAAQIYFKTVREAIKRYDPNHLYLGCRFAQAPKEVVAEAGKFCDIVSFNVYGYQVDKGRFDEFYRISGRPFLVGEFSFGARDSGMLDAGAVAVESQAERGEAYKHYLEALINLPYFVGCHWFEYIDQAFLGRHDGFEASNVGLVDVCDNPYSDLTDRMKEENKKIYDLLAKAGKVAE